MNVCNVVRPHSGCCITASNLYGNEEITECHYNVAMAGSSPFIPIIHHVIRRATLAAIEKTKMLNGDFTVSDSQFLCFLFVFFFCLIPSAAVISDDFVQLCDRLQQKTLVHVQVSVRAFLPKTMILRHGHNIKR